MVVNKDRLHDFQVSNALCAATRDTNQYVAVHLLPEEIASILAPCHSMASLRSCLLLCPSSRSCLLSCRANCIPIMTTVHADCCIFSRPLDSYAATLSLKVWHHPPSPHCKPSPCHCPLCRSLHRRSLHRRSLHRWSSCIVVEGVVVRRTMAIFITMWWSIPLLRPHRRCPCYGPKIRQDCICTQSSML